jgi:hypothetical protein
VTLGVGLATVGGLAPAAQSGQLSSGAITYPAIVPGSGTPSPNLALRSTAAGMDVRFTVHGPTQAGPFVLTLTPDSRTTLQQAGTGPITVTQTLPVYGDDGTQYRTVQEVEFVISAPIARDSSADPVAAATTGPSTMTLQPATAGPQQVSLAIDPAWLQDPHRTFPVTLDLPIATGLSESKTSVFGTVTSCAPTTPAPRTRVAVGTEGGCDYHGLLYFDVTSILPGTPIVSATLNLYTPGQTQSTGVAVALNAPLGTAGGAPPSATFLRPPTPWLPPSWNTAPAPATSVAAVNQSGSDGHWQSWDVTAFVQDWVSQGVLGNGGLTLTSPSAPVLFASPLGAGDDSPDLAPYLQITFGSQSTTTPVSPQGTAGNGQSASTPLYGIGDNARTIFGMASG